MKMNKKLLALPILILPLTVMAQGKPEKMSNTVIETAVDRFVPLICKKGLNAAIQEVQKCYKDTLATYPEIEQCLIADSFVVFNAAIQNHNDIQNKNPIHYPESYIELNQYGQRLEKYRKEIPKYQQYSRLEFRKYVGQSTGDLSDELSIMKHDQTSHCVEE